MRCVIPCGGNSSRLGTGHSKCLIDINNKTVLNHVVSFWQALGIEDFVFIVGGPDAEAIVVEIYRLGLRNNIVINRKGTENLVGAIHLAKDFVGNRFVLALGDCMNIGHFSSKAIGKYGIGVCAVNSEELAKNYRVDIVGERIVALQEKPEMAVGLCGMGTMFLHRDIFSYIEYLDYYPIATSVDLTTTIILAIKEEEDVTPVYFEGTYINITDNKDVEYAKEVLR